MQRTDGCSNIVLAAWHRCGQEQRNICAKILSPRSKMAHKCHQRSGRVWSPIFGALLCQNNANFAASVIFLKNLFFADRDGQWAGSRCRPAATPSARPVAEYVSVRPVQGAAAMPANEKMPRFILRCASLRLAAAKRDVPLRSRCTLLAAVGNGPPLHPLCIPAAARCAQTSDPAALPLHSRCTPAAPRCSIFERSKKTLKTTPVP